VSGFPRVLVVSPSSFNQFSGGGVLLTNLFRGWAKESVAIVHGDPLPTDDAVCGRFFHVGTDEVHWRRPLSWLQGHRTPEKTVLEQGSVRLDTGRSPGRALLKKALCEELPWDATVSPALSAFISDFHPELVYTLPGGAFMRLAMAIGLRWNVPVVPHMMDDWPSAPTGGLLGGVVGARLRRDLRRLFDASAARMAITDDMATEYARRYGKPFHAFSNPVDVAARAAHARYSWKRGAEFHVAYVGSILPQSQLASLAGAARAVSELAAGGERIRLDIFSAWGRDNAAALHPGPAVRIHDALNEANVFPALVAADLLLLPVNFDAASLRLIRLSMPAKVPLYLASGTPILAYGPKAAASIAYAAREQWAHVVDKPDLPALKKAILELANDEDFRAGFAARAKHAVAHHDDRVVRPAFQDVLRVAAGRRL